MKRQTRVKKSHFLVGLLFNFLTISSVAILLLSVTYGVLWLLKPERFPINSVKILGESKRLARGSLQAIVTEQLTAGFFGVDLRELRRAVEALPWVRSAYVERQWPSKLIIQVEEHIPFARWNEDGVITIEGAIIVPPKQTIPSGLPLLEGPLGRHRSVWEQYKVMNGTLLECKQKIMRLALAKRGSWKLYLENGIQVVLGKTEVLARLERFARAYQQVLEPVSSSIAYVDLRYTSGLAVGWKGENQRDG